MHIIGHQSPGPNLHAGVRAMLAEQIAVKHVVRVPKKRLRSTIAPLRDMVRKSGNGDTRE